MWLPRVPCPAVIPALTDRIVVAQGKLRRLATIAQVASPRLVKAGLTIVHELEFDALVLGHYYLPGLLAEGALERTFGLLVINTAHRCGLGWVDDIVIRLDESHGAYPGMAERPVIWAPPYQVETLQDLPALYHELGHVAFNRFPDILASLSDVIDRYREQTRQNAGPLTPDQRAPFGQLLTTLPVGPTRPGLTAGPSFELFYESDYLLPHRDAAWALIAARAEDPPSGLKRSRTSCTGMQESDRPTISDFS